MVLKIRIETLHNENKQVDNSSLTAASQKSILIVDDDLDTIELLELVLSYEGFAVFKATNGSEALSILEEEPDLILLDVMMPGDLSGLDVCKIIKNDKKYKDIPVIIFSSKVLTKDIQQGLAAGANEYITKPFSSKELIGIIRNYLNIL